MIYYLSKIYLKNFFCQFFEYGIFILISAPKLFNSKKNLPHGEFASTVHKRLALLQTPTSNLTKLLGGILTNKEGAHVEVGVLQAGEPLAERGDRVRAPLLTKRGQNVLPEDGLDEPQKERLLDTAGGARPARQRHRVDHARVSRIGNQ